MPRVLGVLALPSNATGRAELGPLCWLPSKVRAEPVPPSNATGPVEPALQWNATGRAGLVLPCWRAQIQADLPQLTTYS